MRNQINRVQRNFVIEYKSGRRQPKEAVRSIWGDADLRALSKAVVDDMPPIAAAERLDILDADGQSPAIAERQHKETLPTISHEGENSPSVPSVEPTAAMAEAATVAPPGSATRQKRKRSQPNSADKPDRSNQAMLSRTPLVSTSAQEPDELAALESENRRLKVLLTDKLRSENGKLAKMLLRFGTRKKK